MAHHWLNGIYITVYVVFLCIFSINVYPFVLEKICTVVKNFCSQMALLFTFCETLSKLLDHSVLPFWFCLNFKKAAPTLYTCENQLIVLYTDSSYSRAWHTVKYSMLTFFSMHISILCRLK